MKTREERLSDIGRKSKQLNQLADNATTEIVELEKRLLEAGVGIEVWDGNFRYDDSTTWTIPEDWQNGGDEVSAIRAATLGFAKVDGHWGIAVNEWTKIYGGGVEEQTVENSLSLLRHAPRDVRIDALSQIDNLLVAIEGAIDAKVSAIATLAKQGDSGGYNER